jgi:tetratricopeptide (TPR) repeat protein
VIRAIVVLAVFGSVAHADVWRHAIEQGSPDTQQDIYESEMKSGDELTLQATSGGVSSENIRQLVRHAAESYRNAANAKPLIAEPYYRLGRLEYSFYFEECDGSQFVQRSPLCPNNGMFDRKHAQEVIDAWDAFEARAPLDPRVGGVRDGALSNDFNLLFHRAVLHTRLASKADPNATAEQQKAMRAENTLHLLAATVDYEKIIERTDLPDETVLSNLAETYMMLNKLDQAIDTYRQALRSNRNTETMYGLAIALDRDERGEQAMDVILAQGEQAMVEFHKRIEAGITFFVPEGEKFYYFALADEAFGKTDLSIENWKAYIASGAHPEFQPRAQAHLDTLVHDKNRKTLHLEKPWQSFIP